MPLDLSDISKFVGEFNFSLLRAHEVYPLGPADQNISVAASDTSAEFIAVFETFADSIELAGMTGEERVMLKTFFDAFLSTFNDTELVYYAGRYQLAMDNPALHFCKANPSDFLNKLSHILVEHNPDADLKRRFRVVKEKMTEILNVVYRPEVRARRRVSFLNPDLAEPTCKKDCTRPPSPSR